MVASAGCGHDGFVGQCFDELGRLKTLVVPVAQLALLIPTCRGHQKET